MSSEQIKDLEKYIKELKAQIDYYKKDISQLEEGIKEFNRQLGLTGSEKVSPEEEKELKRMIKKYNKTKTDTIQIREKKQDILDKSLKRLDDLTTEDPKGGRRRKTKKSKKSRRITKRR